jgi:hypothetical protein
MELYFWIIFIIGIVFMTLWLSGVFKKNVEKDKKKEDQI